MINGKRLLGLFLACVFCLALGQAQAKSYIFESGYGSSYWSLSAASIEVDPLPTLGSSFFAQYAAANPDNTGTAYSLEFDDTDVDAGSDYIAVTGEGYDERNGFSAARTFTFNCLAGATAPGGLTCGNDYYLFQGVSGISLYPVLVNGVDDETDYYGHLDGENIYPAQAWFQDTPIDITNAGSGAFSLTAPAALATLADNINDYDLTPSDPTNPAQLFPILSDSGGDYIDFPGPVFKNIPSESSHNQYGPYLELISDSTTRNNFRAETAGARQVAAIMVLDTAYQELRSYNKGFVTAANVNTSTGVLTTTDTQNLVTGKAVYLKAENGGALPAGLTATGLFVRDTGSKTITLHPTSGDASSNSNTVIPSTQGTGGLTVSTTSEFGDYRRKGQRIFWIHPDTADDNLLVLIENNNGAVTNGTDLASQLTPSTGRLNGQSLLDLEQVKVIFPAGATPPTVTATGLPMAEGIYWITKAFGSSTGVRLHTTYASALASVGLSDASSTSLKFDNTGSGEVILRHEIDKGRLSVDTDAASAEVNIDEHRALHDRTNVVGVLMDFNDPAASLCTVTLNINGLSYTKDLTGCTKGNLSASPLTNGSQSFRLSGENPTHVPDLMKMRATALAASTGDMTTDFNNAVSAYMSAYGVTAATSEPPILLTSPSISGDTDEGSTLTATPGTYLQTIISQTGEWYKDGVATGTTTTTIVSSDAGAVYDYRETARLTNGSLTTTSNTITVTEVAWNIENNIDNRRYWLPTVAGADINGSDELVEAPDFDGSAVSLTPRTGSAAIAYTATNADFNDQPTLTNPGASADGLDSAIADFTSDAASFWGVFKMDSLDLSMFFELGQASSGNKGPQFGYVNGTNNYFFRVPTVTETLPGPTWIVPDGDFLSDTFVFVGRYSAAEGKIEAFIDGKRVGESYVLTGDKTLKNTLNRLHVTNYGWGSAELDGDLATFGVTDDWLSDSEIELMSNVLYAEFIGDKPDTIVVVGDSYSAGYLVTGDGWVDALKTDVASTHRVYNEAISGMRLDYDSNTTLDILYQDEFKNAFSRWAIGTDDKAIVWAGSNDLSDGTTPLEALDKINLLVANLKNDGFEEVYVVGPVDRTGLSDETNALDNLLALESAPVWDGVVPLRTQSEFDDNTNTTYFNADNIHLKDAGQTAAWGYIETVIEGGTVSRVGPSVDNLATPAPAIWLQPDAGKTVSNGRIVEWANQGSLGGEFTNSSASNRPLVATAALSGYDGVEFIGTGDKTRLSASSEMLGVLNNATGATIIAVVDAENTSSSYVFSTNDRLNFGWSQSGSDPVIKSVVRRLDSDTAITTIDTNTDFTDAAPAIIGAKFDYTLGSANGNAYNGSTALDAIDLSGLASSAGNSGSDNSPCVHLGVECSSGTSYFTGTLIELKVWNYVLTPTEYSDQITQLSGKYGIGSMVDNRLIDLMNFRRRKQLQKLPEVA